MWVNKVGPYNNPQETYNYYYLPFCKPKGEKAVHKWGGLGEVLQGNELIDSQLDLKFRSAPKTTSTTEYQLALLNLICKAMLLCHASLSPGIIGVGKGPAVTSLCAAQLRYQRKQSAPRGCLMPMRQLLRRLSRSTTGNVQTIYKPISACQFLTAGFHSPYPLLKPADSAAPRQYAVALYLCR